MDVPLTAFQRPITLTDAVAQSIGEAIVQGQFEPGEPLREVSIARLLGTSRGTVREALRLLSEQGIVEIVRYRGAFVGEATARKAREVFTLRAELEGFAVRLVFENGGYSDSTLTELESVLIDLTHASETSDLFGVAELDMQFHDLLSRECVHQELLRILSDLRLQMRRFIVYTKFFNSDTEPESVTHRRLLDALQSGDSTAAESEVRDHILSAGNQLMAILEDASAAKDDGHLS